VILAAPFVLLVMLMVGVTAYVTLQSTEADTRRLVARLHEETSQNIRLRLDAYLGRRARRTAARSPACCWGSPRTKPESRWSSTGRGGR
jgi:hypothetical protein